MIHSFGRKLFHLRLLSQSNSIKNTKSFVTQAGNSLLYPALFSQTILELLVSFKKTQNDSFAKESLEIYRRKVGDGNKKAKSL